MGFLSQLFNKKNLILNDPDLGELKSIHISGRKVLWKAERKLLGQKIEIRISGNRKGVSQNQKDILLNTLKNEDVLESEVTEALKKQFEKSVIPFTTIQNHFDVIGITMNNRGFEFTFQESDGQFRFFNVLFENNKYLNVTIEEF